MFLVKTFVQNSPIAGLGLFAGENIKKGQIVWQYTPETVVIVTKEQLDNLLESQACESQVRYYLTYGYYVAKFDGLAVCMDDGRFVNHSDAPNIGILSTYNAEQMWQCSVALRDIGKGDEITENYHTFEAAPWHDIMCEQYGLFLPPAPVVR